MKYIYLLFLLILSPSLWAQKELKARIHRRAPEIEINEQSRYNGLTQTDSILLEYKRLLKQNPFVDISRNSLLLKKKNNSQEWLNKVMLLESAPRWNVGFNVGPNLTMPSFGKYQHSTSMNSNYKNDSTSLFVGIDAQVYGEYFFTPKAVYHNQYSGEPVSPKSLKMLPIFSLGLSLAYKTNNYNRFSQELLAVIPATGEFIKFGPTKIVEKRKSLAGAIYMGLSFDLVNKTQRKQNANSFNSNIAKIQKISAFVRLGVQFQYELSSVAEIGANQLSMGRSDMDTELFTSLGFRFRLSKETPIYFNVALRYGYSLTAVSSFGTNFSGIYTSAANTYGYMPARVSWQHLSAGLGFEYHFHTVRYKKSNPTAKN